MNIKAWFATVALCTACIAPVQAHIYPPVVILRPTHNGTQSVPIPGLPTPEAASDLPKATELPRMSAPVETVYQLEEPEINQGNDIRIFASGDNPAMRDDFGIDVGSNSRVRAYYQPRIDQTGSSRDARAAFTFKVGGAVINRERELMSGAVDLRAGRSQGECASSARFTVLGQDIFRQNRTGQSARSWNENLELDRRWWSTTFSLDVYIATIRVEVGVAGKVGFVFTSNNAGGGTNRQVDVACAPNAVTYVFGDASIGAFGFKAGVKGWVWVVNGLQPIWLRTTVAGNRLTRYRRADWQIVLCAGKVEAYAKTPFGKIGSKTLIDFPGWTWNRNIFNQTFTTGI